MTLMTCPDCGKEISNEADACPYCGAKPKLSSGTSKVIGGVFVILIIIGLLNSKDTPAPTPAPFDPVNAALGLCRMHIKAQLHDPDSAEFEESKTTQIQKEGDIWTVQRAVRAKNAFNATRRAEFECQYRLTNENFTLVKVSQVSP
jgi:RNA polymerase subunit RPABC4/transcription elongation factor Spt4